MRIVGGRFRGRRLAAPRSQAIRPTSDRLREALFNILAHAYDAPLAGARVLDLFAGTGALGLESVVTRRGLRAVRRPRRGGARVDPAECRDPRTRRRNPHLSPRRDQARPRASACAVFARLPRSALWQGACGTGARFCARRRVVCARRAGGGRRVRRSPASSRPKDSRNSSAAVTTIRSSFSCGLCNRNCVRPSHRHCRAAPKARDPAIHRNVRARDTSAWTAGSSPAATTRRFDCYFLPNSRSMSDSFSST